MTRCLTILAAASLATWTALFAPLAIARADIFQWEYVNPANPSLGKQQSTTLAADGAGVNAEPGAILSNRNLTMAYLTGADLTNAFARFSNLTNAELSQANLTGASFSGLLDYGEEGGFYPGADLTNANLTQANLSGANFTYATLTGAILANAQVRGANFYQDSTGGSGITLAQLYSTASYQARDLTGINLSGNDLSSANLASQNLTSANFSGDGYYSHGADLSGANLSQTVLTNADFRYATLTGAVLSGSDVRGAQFDATGESGITLPQLYSTASYQAHDLTGISLVRHDLTGADLAGQNLTNANFRWATLTDVNLSGANVRGAYFAKYPGLEGITLAQLYSTASYQAHELTRISLIRHDLTGADLAGQNLTNVNLRDATLTDANLTGANVRGADFGSIYGSEITDEQLYSTASYQSNDLRGIVLVGVNLEGADLAAQNLAGANFQYATLTNANLGHANLAGAKFSHNGNDYVYPFANSSELTGANLSHANLANADFSGWEHNTFEFHIIAGANLAGANLSGADARGANFQYAELAGAITNNLIQPDGHIAGLELTSGEGLTVRNYHGPAAPTLVVDQHLALDTAGALRLVFDADAWGSTISFAPGITVTLGGTLELAFAPEVDVADQAGRAFDLFDWTGVAATGAFTVSSPYTWDLSNLYTTGEVTLAGAPVLPGDYNYDGIVNAADFVVWRDQSGLLSGYNAWRGNFGNALGSGSMRDGAVPEPASVALLIFGFGALLFLRGRCG